MCRLFALVSNDDITLVQKSILLRSFFESSAEEYPAGWGIGYFDDGRPMVLKEPLKATESHSLPGAIRRAQRGFLIAHVRRPTEGSRHVNNTHPFEYQGWLFAHNGTIGDPEGLRGRLLERHAESIRGETDSEILFHYLVQRIESDGDAERAILSTLRTLGETRDEGTTSFNFLLTDGQRLFVTRQAFKDLHKYSLSYASLADVGLPGSANENGPLADSTIISSEPITSGGWKSLEYGQMMVCDKNGRRIVQI